MRRLRSKAKPALPLAWSARLPDGYPPTRPSVSSVSLLSAGASGAAMSRVAP
jgi:hypothetical protein